MFLNVLCEYLLLIQVQISEVHAVIKSFPTTGSHNMSLLYKNTIKAAYELTFDTENYTQWDRDAVLRGLPLPAAAV